MKLQFYKPFCKSLSFLKTTIAVSALVLSAAQQVQAQGKKVRVLFLGNSLTATNMLPLVLMDITRSAGDTIQAEWNMPGAYTLDQHFRDGASIGKITSGNWNYVVLQESNPLAALSETEAEKNVYPFAKSLDSLMHERNKCGRTVFFQTWAFRDGDPTNCLSFPPVCDFKGMDSMLEKRYTKMAIDNKAIVSPVGLVFKAIRSAMPTLNLYEADGINPSEAGTYAAAVTFYTILLGKDPDKIAYDYAVPPTFAAFIRSIVRSEVYASLPKFFVGKYDPNAVFSSSVAGNVATFNTITSANLVNYNWDFGDGTKSTDANPVHTYTTSGTFNVTLIGDNCLLSDTMKSTVTIAPSGISEVSLLNKISIYPNPSSSVLNIKSDIALNKISVSIANVVGAQVINVAQFDGTPINITSLAKGLYLVNIKDLSTGDMITRKLIKE